MSFILTQSGNDKASVKATQKLLDTNTCDFDLHPTAPRLRAISSGMRKCTEGESHYHSFVGELPHYAGQLLRINCIYGGLLSMYYAIRKQRIAYLNTTALSIVSDDGVRSYRIIISLSSTDRLQ